MGCVPLATSHLLQRLRSLSKSQQYASKHAFESDCADLVTMWTNLPRMSGTEMGADLLELISMWPDFVTYGVAYVVSNDVLSCIRPLLEAVLASNAATLASSTEALFHYVIAANAGCIEELANTLADIVTQRTLALTSLMPPLDLMQEVQFVIDLLEEYQFPTHDRDSTHHGDSSQPSTHYSTAGVLRAYVGLVERSATVFIQEVAFPSYCNMHCFPAPTCVLVRGVHPAIYFCFSTMLSLIHGHRRSTKITDERPCRQVVAQVWIWGCQAIISVVKRGPSASIQEQIVRDTMHYVLFARMFRDFIGERYFISVSKSLVELLGVVALHTPDAKVSEAGSEEVPNFENGIWGVAPLSEMELFQLTDNSRGDGAKGLICGDTARGLFLPWSDAFIRASNADAARKVPHEWRSTCFARLP
ncbi:unnamed protein product [Trypanosoma congolense IL3000]|uniref:WGS project CAEQ00000000 data, annotated contig 2457 n=1 Tax=Trypanosoma congolense (strain IL3000) TaxID=1068625 RepID=F9WEC1_TRYCI|nr:unnamed protein product [Trypanosoma congolense IL3000]